MARQLQAARVRRSAGLGGTAWPHALGHMLRPPGLTGSGVQDPNWTHMDCMQGPIRLPGWLFLSASCDVRTLMHTASLSSLRWSLVYLLVSQLWVSVDVGRWTPMPGF